MTRHFRVSNRLCTWARSRYELRGTLERLCPKVREGYTFGTVYDLARVCGPVREIWGFDRTKNLLPHEQRAELSQLQTQLSNIVQTVDTFYDPSLGCKTGVFHGDVNLKRTQEVIQAEDAHAA